MRVLLAAAVLVFPILASADDATKNAVVMHDDECARARTAGKPCVLDMTGDDVENDVPSCGGWPPKPPSTRATAACTACRPFMRPLIAAVLLLAPALAAADDSKPKTPDAAKMHADDCERARNAGKTCVLDMG